MIFFFYFVSSLVYKYSTCIYLNSLYRVNPLSLPTQSQASSWPPSLCREGQTVLQARLSSLILHCGVFCTWQWLHCRWIWTPTGWTWASTRFFCFFAGGKDGSESNVLPNDHTRVLGFLFRTVLALLVIFISHEKRGIFFTEGSDSINRFASSKRTGYKSDSSESESSFSLLVITSIHYFDIWTTVLTSWVFHWVDLPLHE